MGYLFETAPFLVVIMFFSDKRKQLVETGIGNVDHLSKSAN